MLLAIDPGACTGWALYEGHTLAACGLGDPRLSSKHKVLELTRVVVEHPWHRPGDRRSVPNDEIKLGVLAGEWGGLYRQWAPVKYYFPHQWKGSVPKDIQNARDWARLSSQEQDVVNRAARGMAAGKRHNMMDAIGLGLFGLGR